MQPFHWKKMGLSFHPNIPGFTHASHPCVTHIDDTMLLVAFASRNSESKSHIFLAPAVIADGRLQLLETPRLSLTPGAPGYFDCDGVISTCFIRHRDVVHLYYVGWQNLPRNMWISDTGRAVVDVESMELKREFPGPVLGRNKDNPLFAAATAFVIINGKWHTWYNSGIKWEETENGLKHYYGIHHAVSDDGVDWVCDKGMCIPFAHEYEYAFGRPSVIQINGVYCMWFAHRATTDVDAYRMGFASSRDGLQWTRNDLIAGIDVSPDGWDSEMICYPYVFEYKGKHYMLYNGNGYGKTGFGLAVLEQD